jgi:hypothetical protein
MSAVRALATDSGEPLPRVGLALGGVGGDDMTAVTDDEGRASLRVPEGLSHLEISGRDPMTLMLFNGRS